MKRRTFFLMGVVGTAGCSRGRERRLNVFNWSAYVAPNTVPDFEREYGIPVRYSVYESNEEMLARVMTGNSGWDVVFPTNYFIEPMRGAGLLAPIDHARLSNLHRLDAMFQRPEWDPELRWSVPYMWGASGIVSSPKAATAPRAWADLWNPALAGKMTMLDDPVDVFAACLKKLGLSMNTKNPEDLRRAQAEAMTQKKLLRAYLNAEVRDQLVAGDVVAAQLWSTTSQQAIDALPELTFCFPSEGFAVYPDTCVVLEESPRKEAAHMFLDYLLRPNVAAAIVQATRTATVNADARALLPPETRNNQTLYPPPEIMKRGEWAKASTPEIQRLRDRLWTEVKSS